MQPPPLRTSRTETLDYATNHGKAAQVTSGRENRRYRRGYAVTFGGPWAGIAWTVIGIRWLYRHRPAQPGTPTEKGVALAVLILMAIFVTAVATSFIHYAATHP